MPRLTSTASSNSKAVTVSAMRRCWRSLDELEPATPPGMPLVTELGCFSDCAVEKTCPDECCPENPCGEAPPRFHSGEGGPAVEPLHYAPVKT